MNNLILKTAQSEVRTDKNGRNYKVVTFTEAKTVNTPFGEMLVPADQCKSRAITQYEENYLSTEAKKVKDLGYDAPIFDSKNPTKGGWFLGSIETRNVEEYHISNSQGNDSYPTTFSTVIFGDTTSPAFETLVRAAFKSAGHPVVDLASASPVAIPAEPVATPSEEVPA